MKKILSIFLAFAIILSILPISVGAAELSFNGNKIRINNNTIGPYTLQYLEVYLQSTYAPISIIRAEQEGSVISIYLSEDTNPSAALQAGFSGTGSAILMSGGNALKGK